MASAWKTVRVFISSTFRDMHAERDHLVKVTFPRLRQWCEERRLHLDDIDLRWGVTQEEANSGKIIEICLKEIDGCRPFFVCLLGSRYGKTPDQLPADERSKFRGLQAQTHKSITHLEIEHATEASLFAGIEQEPPASEYAFFYFRKRECLPDPQSLTDLSPVERKEYADAFLDDSAQRAEMLAELKAQFRRRFEPLGRVFEYSGVWNSRLQNPEDDRLKGRLTHLEELGLRVEADLKAAIEIKFANHLAELEVRDPLSEGLAYHDAFIESRNRVYVPRSEVESAIMFYVDGDDPRPLIVVGPPGSGKSAVLAHWTRTHEELSTDVVLSRFVGASPSSTSVHGLLTSLCNEIVSRFHLDVKVPVDPAELRSRFHWFLEEAGKQSRTVIVLDALNQLNRSTKQAEIGWLRKKLPRGVRMVISVLHEEPAQKSTSPRPGVSTTGFNIVQAIDGKQFSIPPLTQEERRDILRQVPSLRAKTLSDEQVQKLVQNRATSNPLFLHVALDELRVFGSFEKLHDEINQLPKPDTEDSLLDSAIEQMFTRVLNRLEQESDHAARGLVSTLFRLLSTAREGLSENDLRTLLGTSLSSVPERAREDELQVVLRQSRGYLVRKGGQQDAVIDFHHRSFWKAVRSRYLPDEAAQRESHRQLAMYFLGQANYSDDLPNERKSVELIWNCLRSLDSSTQEGNGSSASVSSDVRQLAGILQDREFIEAKSSAGRQYELVQEFEEAHDHLKASDGELAQASQHSLLNLIHLREQKKDQVLNRVSVHAWLAYRKEREFYLSLLQAANSETWQRQAPEQAFARTFAMQCRDDFFDICRREGRLSLAKKHLPAILRYLEHAEEWKSLGTAEYRWAYIHFLQGRLADAIGYFEKSFQHAHQGDDEIGEWISRCLHARLSFLHRRWTANQFREVLESAEHVFESHPGRDVAVRWVSNFHCHMFEIAFTQCDRAACAELLEEITKSAWMQQRPEEELFLRLLPYQGRLAMLDENWNEAKAKFERLLNAKSDDWDTKKGEAITREFLDFGIACAESGDQKAALRAWNRGLKRPDKLGNKIWKAEIHDAMQLLDSKGRCWADLKNNLRR